MSESQLTKKMIKALRNRGAWCFKVHGGPYQSAGIPDIVGCHEGLFFALEVKVPGRGDTLTKLQQGALTEIQEAGGIAEMVMTVEEAVDHVLSLD